MRMFFTSDLHLGHVRALEIMPHRPWSTVDEMNEALIDRHNFLVGSEDTIVYLGDLIMGKKSENVPKFLPRLNGHKVLVCGNHDFLPSEQKPEKLKELEELYLANGIEQIVYGCTKLSMLTHDSRHSNINLCHFPPASTVDGRESEYDQRYTHLRPTLEDGEYLLHGHTHSRMHHTAPRMLHVGVDAEEWGFMPVSLHTVCQLLTSV